MKRFKELVWKVSLFCLERLIYLLFMYRCSAMYKQLFLNHIHVFSWETQLYYLVWRIIYPVTVLFRCQRLNLVICDVKERPILWRNCLLSSTVWKCLVCYTKEREAFPTVLMIESEMTVLINCTMATYIKLLVEFNLSRQMKRCGHRIFPFLCCHNLNIITLFNTFLSKYKFAPYLFIL